MSIDNSFTIPFDSDDLKTQLFQMVAENKISSLSMMSNMSGIEEAQIRSILDELVDDGVLYGSFTPDGLRFFLSEVRTSQAPVVISNDEGYAIKEKDTKIPKLILISGIIMMVAGYIIRGFSTTIEMMEHIGGAILIVGMAIMIAGWFMISRANPPSKIK